MLPENSSPSCNPGEFKAFTSTASLAPTLAKITKLIRFVVMAPPAASPISQKPAASLTGTQRHAAPTFTGHACLPIRRKIRSGINSRSPLVPSRLPLPSKLRSPTNRLLLHSEFSFCGLRRRCDPQTKLV